ncbi:unnamed protein product [Urochloa decumbens]|uniref:Uncharacterized protein n=1 Tax=Urochloa decumbens TaxID=240449 RepID=A0ABC8WSM0_9POAL
MSRRFLNLVCRDYTASDGLLYSITRLDASQLFYKSNTAASRKKNGSKQAPVTSSIADIPEIRRLPSPTFSFQPFRSKMYQIIKGVDVFAPFGAGGDGGKILCADGAGYAAAFDMASRSMLGMPTMNAPKGPMHVTISSIAGTTVFVSPDAAAAAEEEGSAEGGGHVPELGVWLGLSAQNPYHLCAISSLDPPVVRHVWSDFDPPESWWLLEHALISLGSGRFCTAKFFDVSEDIKDDDAYETAVVFTGVEVLRCDDESVGGLKMIKHKSKCMTDLDIISVL